MTITARRSGGGAGAGPRAWLSGRRPRLAAPWALPAWVVAGVVVASAAVRADDPPSATLPLPGAGTAATRVRLRLDVTGELVAPAGPDAAAERRPVTMQARFDFDESSAVVPPAAGGGLERPPAVLRRYADAAAEIRVGAETVRPALAADARNVLVSRVGTTPMPYLAGGFLSGEEYELLETPFDPLLLEGLLSGAQVAVGDTWQVAADVAAGLLAIDTVDAGAIDARLDEVAEGVARVSLSGIVDGAVDGVPTHVTIEGTFATAARRVPAADGGAGNADGGPAADRFELWGPVSQVAATLHERRQASHVAPGFDLEARLALTQTPIAAAEIRVAAGHGAAGHGAAGRGAAARSGDDDAVAAEAGRPAPRRRGAGGPGRVWYRAASGRFDLVRDSRWRVVEDGPDGLVMRFVDRGALVAQCSITTLELPAAGAASPTAADLERDVQRTLAGQVVRTEPGAERIGADGTRIVRVASSGTAGGLPFNWIHYVLTAADGSRANVTFMFESSMRRRFAEADAHLIEGMRTGRADRMATRAAAGDTTAD